MGGARKFLTPNGDLGEGISRLRTQVRKGVAPRQRLLEDGWFGQWGQGGRVGAGEPAAGAGAAVTGAGALPSEGGRGKGVHVT